MAIFKASFISLMQPYKLIISHIFNTGFSSCLLCLGVSLKDKSKYGRKSEVSIKKTAVLRLFRDHAKLHCLGIRFLVAYFLLILSPAPGFNL